MRKGFTSNAKFLVTRVLGLPARTPIARYLILFVSFVLVAFLHIFASLSPFRCSVWPQVRYYGSTACAIVVEDTVITLAWRVRQQFRRKGAKDVLEAWKREGESSAANAGSNVEQKCSKSLVVDDSPAKRWRMVGYVWVALFDLWATSKLVYASAICR